MNIICKLTITGFLCPVLLFTSCKKDRAITEKSDYHLAISDSLISNYNAKHNEHEKSVNTIGIVNITVNDSLITIDQNPENAEESVTYFLYTKMKFPELKNGSFGKAEIIYLDRNLIVNSLESQKILFFSILGDLIPGYVNELKNVTHYNGYGLGYRKVVKENPPEVAPYCSCIPNGSLNAICASGGEGASTCATGNLGGSCRISCSGQTFPCCDIKME